jgi:dihydrofolate synthase / folylpolyglutamate synthase
MFGDLDEAEAALAARAYAAGISLGLERMTQLAAATGTRSWDMPGVLIAGTNGKGSVRAMIAAVLVACGWRVGSNPSPHLHSYAERILIDEQELSEPDFLSAIEVAMAADAAGELGGTEFELLTAAAFAAFDAADVDVVVAEVGLGGAADATNIYRPAVKVITSIGLDHMAFLGHTLAEIATQKAGIIHEADTVIIGDLPPDARASVDERAAQVGARVLVAGAEVDVRRTGSTTVAVTVHDADRAAALGLVPGLAQELPLTLAGDHQMRNLTVALTALAELTVGLGRPVKLATLRDGLARVLWPGRAERAVGPGGVTLVVDVAHNAEGIAALVADVQSPFGLSGDIAVVLGCLRDKDIEGIVAAFPSSWHIIVTSSSGPRALAASELADRVTQLGRRITAVEGDPVAAVREAARMAGSVVVCGGFAVAGRILRTTW